MKNLKSKKYICFEMMITMLGSIVGVGFITGVEIYDFFAKFKINMIFGCLILLCLFFLLIYKITGDCYNCNNENKMYNFNKYKSKNTFYIKKRIKDIFLFFNLVMISSAMLSGLKLVLNKLLFNNYYVVFIICIMLVFALLYFGIKGLSKFNYLLILVLMFVVCTIVNDMVNRNPMVVDFGEFTISQSALSIMFAFIYVFMNIVEVQPVICEYKYNFSQKGRVVFSLLFSIILIALILIISLFLLNNKALCLSEMPIFSYFDSKPKYQKLLFSCGLIMALMSTLLTCLIGVKNKIQRIINDKIFVCFCSVFICLIISILPFSFFTKIIYPLIGVINFVVFVFL